MQHLPCRVLDLDLPLLCYTTVIEVHSWAVWVRFVMMVTELHGPVSPKRATSKVAAVRFTLGRISFLR